MADNHGAATADSGMDMPAHEAMYESFVDLTANVGTLILCIVLCLLIWGIEGHGFVALIGFILACAGSTLGGLTGLGWKTVLPVFALLGLAAIIL